MDDGDTAFLSRLLREAREENEALRAENEQLRTAQAEPPAPFPWRAMLWLVLPSVGLICLFLWIELTRMRGKG